MGRDKAPGYEDYILDPDKLPHYPNQGDRDNAAWMAGCIFSLGIFFVGFIVGFLVRWFFFS